MKSPTEHRWFETTHRRDYLNITDTVAQLVRKSAVQEGLCLVHAMHITANPRSTTPKKSLPHGKKTHVIDLSLFTVFNSLIYNARASFKSAVS